MLRIIVIKYFNSSAKAILSSLVTLPFQVQFTILQTDSPIKINKRDGTVYVDGTIDREVTPIIKIKIIARDGGLFEDEQVSQKCIVFLSLVLKFFETFWNLYQLNPISISFRNFKSQKALYKMKVLQI